MYGQHPSYPHVYAMEMEHTSLSVHIYTEEDPGHVIDHLLTSMC